MRQLTEALWGLIRSDIETIECYEQALPDFDTPELARQLEAFVEAHEKHVQVLKQFLQELGEEEVDPYRPVHNEDSMHERHSSPGATLETLKALEKIRQTELITYESYLSMLSQELPVKVKRAIEEFVEHERTHQNELQRIYSSVKAAAALWGPAGYPTILHH